MSPRLRAPREVYRVYDEREFLADTRDGTAAALPQALTCESVAGRVAAVATLASLLAAVGIIAALHASRPVAVKAARPARAARARTDRGGLFALHVARANTAHARRKGLARSRPSDHQRRLGRISSKSFHLVNLAGGYVAPDRIARAAIANVPQGGPASAPKSQPRADEHGEFGFER